jgi:hypothetical protein
MPQDDPRTDKDYGRQQRAGARSEQMRGENTAAAEAMSTRMAETGAKSFNAGLRVQAEMFDTLQTIGRQWVERRTCEAELALNLPNRLVGARTLPDAVSVYQEWLGEWLAMCNEDGRRFVSDGQKIVATSVRCFTNISPSTPS